MPFSEDLQTLLENEEHETCGSAFGGNLPQTHTSYSVVKIRNFILNHAPYTETTALEMSLKRANSLIPSPLFKVVVSGVIRFSFLIELTNVKVGSTKMKTRWLPGNILMPQENSFEPILGIFQPGNDPRAATFEDCSSVFAESLTQICNAYEADPRFGDLLLNLKSFCRVPYEIALTYRDSMLVPVHRAPNVGLAQTGDAEWLVVARRLLRETPASLLPAVRAIEQTKLEVKVYKTDRSLTGKDKTNRAKRWEVLAGDFQHATLEECWSAERKLTADLTCFAEFPETIKAGFIANGLIERESPVTRCPVTLDPLNFSALAASVLGATHGVSDYQIGHLKPLKRGGKHDGENVCWQSADGNRIQGDLTIEETVILLEKIASNRSAI